VSLKGGLGSASAVCGAFVVGALAAVNAAGSAVVAGGPWFWAAPFERETEFGGCGFPSPLPDGALEGVTKGAPQASTTLAVVATDAILGKAEAKRLAVMAQVGRAIYPIHTPLDGDVVFAVATGRNPAPVDLTALGTIAANCLARAVARGVYEAAALPFPGALPAWRDRFVPGGRP
jgi:D-aminopeptidase